MLPLVCVCGVWVMCKSLFFSVNHREEHVDIVFGLFRSFVTGGQLQVVQKYQNEWCNAEANDSTAAPYDAVSKG